MAFTGTATLILAATSGIGSALARRIRAGGGTVIPAGRNAERLEAISAELGEPGIAFDAASFESVESAVQQAAARHGRLDGVALCSGSLLLKPAHLTTEAEYRATLAANLDAAFATVRASAKVMMQTGGSIVLVSSAAARIGLGNHEAIAAAKAGILGLTLAAAASYAQRGIRVNCVAPGPVWTPLIASTRDERFVEKFGGDSLWNRPAQPAELAPSYVFLASADARYYTGEILCPSGYPISSR